MRRGVRVVLAGLGLSIVAAPLNAQNPVLQLTGWGAEQVQGVSVAGSASFPVRTLELLGFSLDVRDDITIAVSGADTLRFWPTSPFFRVGAVTHQLAYPITRAGGGLHLPEQFFIRWLPDWRPERYSFSGGVLGTAGRESVVAVDPEAIERAAARSEASRTRVVVIDAGHGGRDPGKIAPNGLREKDVTLLLARQLAAVMEARGYEVHLTRTSDTLIALHDRPRLANEWRADRPVAVFLSIHANAFTSSSVRGFETFFLSEARTEDERRVAAMENDAVRFEEDRPTVADAGLDQILSNLRSDFLMRASHDLAASVQDRLAAFHPGPNRGVKRGELIVLIGSIMPAVLIETGFLSNRQEADLLGTRSFQNQIVTSIADAVDDFFQRNEHLWVHGL